MPRKARQRPSRDRSGGAEVIVLRPRPRSAKTVPADATGGEVIHYPFGAGKRSERQRSTSADIAAVRAWEVRHPGEAGPKGWEEA